LGLKYFYAEGVPQDIIEAVKWYLKAAQQEQADAQNWLGDLYQDGIFVPQDDAEAEKWYRKAAKQGDAKAQLKLDGMKDK
jgi:TPR repeat protein